MEKDYFDAKFDGLEKLMMVQDGNVKAYLGAVSANVRQVREDLQKHKEDSEAHGAGVVVRKEGSIVQWISLAVAIVAALGVFAPLFHK